MSAVAVTHVGPWTIDDLYELPATDVRYELYDGALIVNAAPNLMHQYVAGELRYHLREAAPPDALVVESPGIAVPGGFFVPDVAVLPRELARVSRREVPGELVWLAVEVESPHGRRRDRVLKATAYAEAKIPLYWRVEREDEQAAPVVVVQELRGGAYVETARLSPGELGRVERPFPVEFDPADLLP